MNTIHISHWDLDGFGCQMVIGNYLYDTYKNFYHNKINCGYSKIYLKLQELDDILSTTNVDVVYITDLLFETNDFNKLIMIINHYIDVDFVFIDHHEYHDERLEGLQSLKVARCLVLHNEKMSATKICLKYVTKKLSYNALESTHTFVDRIDAYDIHLIDTHHYKMGFVYNSLFWEYGLYKFNQKYFFNHELEQNDRNVYKKIVKNKNDYYKDKEKKAHIMKSKNKEIVIGYVDDFISFFSQEYADYSIHIIITNHQKLSFRVMMHYDDEQCKSIKHTIMQEVEPFCDSNGGHLRAYGANLKEGVDTMSLVETIVETIGDLIDTY
jgi:oligoribonuclease NrnB/cAMP/cGMP phosphodiesterase (DHH superfamily)